MDFMTSLPGQHRVLDNPGPADLAGAVHALAASIKVRMVALDLAARLRPGANRQCQVHVRALPGGALEMVAVSSGALSLGSVYHDPGVTVLTDRWRDGSGDCALVRVLPGPRAIDLPFGVIERSLGDAPFSGDAWAVSAAPDGVTVLVIDGLGHGPLAEAAAVAGVEALRGIAPVSPSDDLRTMHDAMRGTVGAAAAVARVAGHGVVDFSGVGNVEATLVIGSRRAGLASYPGVVGQGSPSFRLFRHVTESRACLVLHTDGLRSRWSPANYPGLFAHHPALIAGVLFRDCWLNSDDALVLVFEVGEDVQTRFARLPV